MKKIRIAFIGVEHDHATFNISSVLRHSKLFEPVCYALPEVGKDDYNKRLKIFGKLPLRSVEEILNDNSIDAVMIETFEMNLTKYALMAAKHKKHIFMDKPGGEDLKEFGDLISAVKQNNLVLQIGYMYRFNPVIKKALNDVKSGKYGTVISVEAQMDCFHPIEKRRWLAHFKGGMMFYLGCHLVDIILQIQGLPEKIIPFNKCSDPHNDAYNDFAVSVFEYKNGISFAKTVACELGGFARRQIVIHGTKGTLEIKPIEMYAKNMPSDSLTTKSCEYRSADWNDCGIKTVTEPYNRYDDMTAFFAHRIMGDENQILSYDYELELYQTLLKCCNIQKEEDNESNTYK